MIRLPVRIDFIGGWSDQPCWKGESAVINAAVGWDGYPVVINDGVVLSKIEGIGTGLGLSSIIEAGKFLEKNPIGDYINHVLKYEKSIGVQGGWQDQIGAIEPGFKLITSSDHKTFDIKRCDNHPIMKQVVIFDTGVRRKSSSTGDRMREMLSVEGEVFELVEEAVRVSKEAFYNFDADHLAAVASWTWCRLIELVPSMDSPVPIPNCDASTGYKLLGAGGGGYGLMFVDKPENRETVIDMFRSYGMNAAIPRLLEVSYE